VLSELDRSRHAGDGDAAGIPVMPVECQLIDALAAKDWTIAIAESFTGATVNTRLGQRAASLRGTRRGCTG